MNEQDRKARNTERLQQLNPQMRAKIVAIIADMEGHGFRPRIQEAWRSPGDQLAAYNSGHSKLQFGFHNVTNKDGSPNSFAVDLLDDDHPAQEGRKYLLTLAASAKAHGCQTGIRWGLAQRLRDAIDAAIAGRNFDAPVKVGWDPTHIEPMGVTPAQVKAGVRLAQ